MKGSSQPPFSEYQLARQLYKHYRNIPAIPLFDTHKTVLVKNKEVSILTWVRTTKKDNWDLSYQQETSIFFCQLECPLFLCM